MNHETSQYLHQRDLGPKRGQRKTKEQNEPMTETRAQRRSRRYSDSVRAEMDVSLSESTKRIRTCGSSFLLRTSYNGCKQIECLGRRWLAWRLFGDFRLKIFFQYGSRLRPIECKQQVQKDDFSVSTGNTYERKQGHNISLLHMTIDSAFTAFEQSAAFVAGGVFYKVRSRTWLQAASRSYQHQEAHKYFHFKD